MDWLENEIERFFLRFEWSQMEIEWGKRVVWLLIIWLLTLLLAKIFRHFFIPVLQKISHSTKIQWDDHLFKDEVLHKAARIIPPVVWYLLLPVAFKGEPYFLDICLRITQIYLIIVSLMLINAVMGTLYKISNMNETLRSRPLKGVYQMVVLISGCIGVILIISVLLGKNATTILAGLGASAAILMLIFKDSILGLVAGVQLSANDMLRPGDWITMSKYGADGYVTEVTLTTVKIQNFDKTITTIPPYALVSDSFQNWRGMYDCGGRRIKRSLLIDAPSVRFCTAEECRYFKEQHWIDETDESKGRLVNLYVYRKYVLNYLKNSPNLHAEMLQMVRMMQPTAEGIPLEVYCFTRDTNWICYENSQGEIFDHLLAMLPEFGLRIYQRPSGLDIQDIKSSNICSDSSMKS